MNAPAQPGHNQPAVIEAEFANWKTVPTRSVLQLIMEVPIEAQAAVLTALGAPIPGQSQRCAIALLRAPAETPAEEPPAKEKQKWNEMPPCQQAVLAAMGTRFQDFAAEMGDIPSSEGDASHFIRDNCGIKSRSELNTNDEAADLWRTMYKDYRQWAGLEAEERG